MNITDLSNFEELRSADTATILGGDTFTLVETPLDLRAASIILGEDFTDARGATYTVFVEDGRLNDQIAVIPQPIEGGTPSAFAQTGVFF